MIKFLAFMLVLFIFKEATLVLFLSISIIEWSRILLPMLRGRCSVTSRDCFMQLEDITHATFHCFYVDHVLPLRNPWPDLRVNFIIKIRRYLQKKDWSAVVICREISTFNHTFPIQFFRRCFNSINVASKFINDLFGFNPTSSQKVFVDLYFTICLCDICQLITVVILP